jgi:predicted component of type VI protein secretion system
MLSFSPLTMGSVIVTVDSAGGPSEIREFHRSPIKIGRGVENDLCLPLSFVSDKHGEIAFSQAGATYTDLGSTNGTLREGQRLEARVPIAITDVLGLEIGSIRLRLQVRHEGSPRVAAPSDDRPAPSPSPVIRSVRREITVPVETVGPSPEEPQPDENDFPLVTPPEEPLGESLEPWARADSGGKATGAKGGRKPRPILALPTIFPMAPERRAQDQPAVRLPEVVASPVATSGSAPNKPTEAGTDNAVELTRLRLLTKTFCEELIRLRTAYEVLGKEIGIRTFTKERARIVELSDPAEMARYLGTGAPARHDELKQLFADMAAHHLAMMGAIVEGARATLARVDPSSVDDGRKGLLALFQNRWEEYTENYRTFVDDDAALQAAVFGPEFAEAYAAARGR